MYWANRKKNKKKQACLCLNGLTSESEHSENEKREKTIIQKGAVKLHVNKLTLFWQPSLILISPFCFSFFRVCHCPLHITPSLENAGRYRKPSPCTTLYRYKKCEKEKRWIEIAPFWINNSKQFCFCFFVYFRLGKHTHEIKSTLSNHPYHHSHQYPPVYKFILINYECLHWSNTTISLNTKDQHHKILVGKGLRFGVWCKSEHK